MILRAGRVASPIVPRRLLLLACAVLLVDTLFYAAVAPILPYYTERFGLSKAAAGFLTAAYPAGTLVFAIPAGILAARFGVRAAVLIGLNLLGLASVVFAFAESVPLLDAARFVQGAAGACSWAGALAWVVGAAPPERRGEVSGTALGAAVFGALLGPAVGGLAVGIGPEPVFASTVVLTLALSAWVLRTPSAAPGERQPVRLLFSTARRPEVVSAAWLILLPAIVFGVLEVLVPLRLDVLGAGTAAISVTFVASAALEAVMARWIGSASDRLGRYRPIRAGLAATIAFALLAPWLEPWWLLAVLVVVSGVAFGMLFAPATALLGDAAESAGLNLGFAYALGNLAWAGGQAIGSSGGGGLAEASADAVTYGVLAALLAVTVALLGRAARAGSGPGARGAAAEAPADSAA